MEEETRHIFVLYVDFAFSRINNRVTGTDVYFQSGDNSWRLSFHHLIPHTHIQSTIDTCFSRVLHNHL